jgi:hypothetical protein
MGTPFRDYFSTKFPSFFLNSPHVCLRRFMPVAWKFDAGLELSIQAVLQLVDVNKMAPSFLFLLFHQRMHINWNTFSNHNVKIMWRVLDQ